MWSNLVGAAHLAAGETVLVHGGAGGVGTVAVQVAVALGARVLVTAGSQERVDACVALGAEAGFVYRTTDGSSFTEALPGLVQEQTDGRGADVILDVVGAAYLDANLRSLATGGRLVVIGMQKGSRAELDLGRLLTPARLRGRARRCAPGRAPRRRRSSPPSVSTCGRCSRTAGVRPVVHAEVPMRDASRAHELMDSGAVLGKVLLVT